MAELPISQERIAGLVKLRTLEEDSFKELMTALSGAPPVLRPTDLVAYLVPKVTSITETNLREILAMLISLSVAQVRANISTSQLTGDVCTVMGQSENQQLKLGGEECDSFRDRLVGLLNIESLMYPAKANWVMADHDRIFQQARVLTDIRAVFGPDIGVLPKGAVIIHMLNVTYRHGGKKDNFYVAMDSLDVESLIATLQRALAKATTLNKVLEKADLTRLDPE